MVTLHVLKLLEDEGLGTIDVDLFYEEVPLDSSGNPKMGVWIVTRGSPVSRFGIGVQAFDLYCRHSSKIETSTKLENILEYLQQAYGAVCDLPTVPPYSLAEYTDCMITPTSSVESVGSDNQDMIVKVISGEIRYKKL